MVKVVDEANPTGERDTLIDCVTNVINRYQSCLSHQKNK